MISEDEAWMRKKRDAKRDRVYLWQDRTIPYEFAPGISMDLKYFSFCSFFYKVWVWISYSSSGLYFYLNDFVW